MFFIMMFVLSSPLLYIIIASNKWCANKLCCNLVKLIFLSIIAGIIIYCY